MGSPEKSNSNKVLVTVSVPAKSKSYKIPIPVDWTVEQFIAKFKEQKKEEIGDAPLTATLKRTNQELNLNSTIKKAEVVDGDTILLRSPVIGG